MIGQIKNPWIRRTLLIAFLPLWLPIGLIIDLVATIEEHYRAEFLPLIEQAWRGPVE